MGKDTNKIELEEKLKELEKINSDLAEENKHLKSQLSNANVKTSPRGQSL